MGRLLTSWTLARNGRVVLSDSGELPAARYSLQARQATLFLANGKVERSSGPCKPNRPTGAPTPPTTGALGYITVHNEVWAVAREDQLTAGLRFPDAFSDIDDGRVIKIVLRLVNQ